MSVSFALPNETSIMIVSDEWHCILLSLGHTAKLLVIITKLRFDMNHKSIRFRRKDWLKKKLGLF